MFRIINRLAVQLTSSCRAKGQIMPMEEDHVSQDIGVVPTGNAGTQYAVYKIGRTVKGEAVCRARPRSRRWRSGPTPKASGKSPCRSGRLRLRTRDRRGTLTADRKIPRHNPLHKGPFEEAGSPPCTGACKLLLKFHHAEKTGRGDSMLPRVCLEKNVRRRREHGRTGNTSGEKIVRVVRVLP